LYTGEIQRFTKKGRAVIDTDQLVVSPIVQLELTYLHEIERLTVGGADIPGDLASRIGLSTSDEYRWFALLAEFDRRLGWQQWECHSCVAWMAWQLGLDARTTRVRLRVAHALTVSSLIAEQMRLGHLSYSKVRAITRIAEPANEASLVQIALAGTTTHVERVVAGYRRGLPPGDDEETVTHNNDEEVVGVSERSSVIRGRLRRLVQLRDRTCRVPGCDHRALSVSMRS